MASTIEVNGDGTVTIGFAYTAATDKVTVTLNAAAHMLYNRAPPTISVDTGEVDAEGAPIMQDEVIAWDDMTNAQKLALLDKFILSNLHELALGYLHNSHKVEDMERRAADVTTIL